LHGSGDAVRCSGSDSFWGAPGAPAPLAAHLARELIVCLQAHAFIPMARVVVARWSPLRWLVCWLRARVHRQFESVCVFPIGTATTTCTSVARLLGLPLDVIGAKPCSDPFTPASFTATIHCCSTATVYCLIHCCLVHCCLFHCCLVCCLVHCSLVAMTSTCHALLVLFCRACADRRTRFQVVVHTASRL
jgi:hypothetical protein